MSANDCPPRSATKSELRMGRRCFKRAGRPRCGAQLCRCHPRDPRRHPPTVSCHYYSGQLQPAVLRDEHQRTHAAKEHDDRPTPSAFTLVLNFRSPPTSCIHGCLPSCHIECAGKRTSTTRDVEDFDLDAFLRKRFSERRRRCEPKLFPQSLRRNEFTVSTRQAQIEFFNKLTHRGMPASSGSMRALVLPR